MPGKRSRPGLKKGEGMEEEKKNRVEQKGMSKGVSIKMPIFFCFIRLSRS